jgi:hypothetical protein
VRYAEDEYNIWIEPLRVMNRNTFSFRAATRRFRIDKAKDIIPCDSADKYTGERCRDGERP